MKRCRGLGDLDLAGRKARPGARPLLQPPGEERLAAAVFSTHRLEATKPSRDCCKVSVQGCLKPLHADGERSEALARHRSPAQRVEYRGPALGAGHVAPPRSNWRRSRRKSSTTSSAVPSIARTCA